MSTRADGREREREINALSEKNNMRYVHQVEKIIENLIEEKKQTYITFLSSESQENNFTFVSIRNFASPP
jgi:hypothetical protein